MKAILIAAGMGVLCVAIVATAFRLLPANVRTAAFLNRLFPLTLLAAIGIYTSRPATWASCPEV